MQGDLQREQALERFDTLMLLCCGFRTWCEKAEYGWSKSQERRIPADLLTKYLPGVKVSKISRSLGFSSRAAGVTSNAAYVGVV